ncbi:hypothetical protein QL285_081381 [Trifolium repens]|nr:hypothetical protein QL285_081381 [Trifolium repens]
MEISKNSSTLTSTQIPSAPKRKLDYDSDDTVESSTSSPSSIHAFAMEISKNSSTLTSTQIPSAPKRKLDYDSDDTVESSTRCNWKTGLATQIAYLVSNGRLSVRQAYLMVRDESAAKNWIKSTGKNWLEMSEDNQGEWVVTKYMMNKVNKLMVYGIFMLLSNIDDDVKLSKS